ncbi:MAG: hypothetical protein JXP48_02575 [Acidobacteria bacterium]|nr:hypothetical protein [Acidobacteriota bacterium]
MVLLMGMLLSFAAAGATAETRFGVRAGAGVDPDQFHFGGHLVSEPLLANLTFRPNLEIGVGSNVTGVAANFEFAYGIPLPKRDLSLYIGAGPALNVYRFGDSDGRDGRTDAGGGFNVLVGLEQSKGLMAEIKVGMIDSPEFKFTVGYTF